MGTTAPSERHIVLTLAEAETLRAIIEHGLTNAGLAAHFDVSEAAIASRLHRFYERTAMAGRIEAVLWSYEHLGCCVAAKLG